MTSWKLLTVGLVAGMTALVCAQGVPAGRSADVVPAKIVVAPPPVYPPEARAKGVEGAVVLRETVGKDGVPRNISFVSGPYELQEAAINAVSKWIYKPATLDGVPVDVDIQVSVDFKVTSEKSGRDSSAGVTASAGPGQAGKELARPARVSGGVMAGQILTREQPVYPEEAKAAHVEGAVVLHAIVGKDGTVEDLQVVSGPEMLRSSALEAVRQWKYKPYLLNGAPVAVDTVVTVNFTLQTAGPEAGTGGVMGHVPNDAPPAQMPAGRIRVSQGVMAGMVQTKTNPVYPEDAKAARVTGAVVLRGVVDRTGKVIEVSAISGPEMLRDAAVDAVRQWTYKPFLLNGEPVEVATTMIVNFTLSD